MITRARSPNGKANSAIAAKDSLRRGWARLLDAPVNSRSATSFIVLENEGEPECMFQPYDGISLDDEINCSLLPRSWVDNQGSTASSQTMRWGCLLCPMKKIVLSGFREVIGRRNTEGSGGTNNHRAEYEAHGPNGDRVMFLRQILLKYEILQALRLIRFMSENRR